ncbi:MAG: ABC transporter ATP-binding protein, partial [Microbacteriaceae bacterium]|nr:ABC transporter ATP-binding protein [Microbacteriaceae bacterium]
EETAARFDEIVEFSGIAKFIDTQVKFYSSGMYVRLAFAVAVHCDPDILLVDEVLAVGDEPFQNKCLNKIRSFQEEGRTIIMVSHNLSQITDFCTRAVVLGQGNVIFDGDPDQAVEILREGFRTIEEASVVRERIAREKAQEGEAARRHAQGEITAIRALPVREPLRPGDSLAVEVDFELHHDLPRWNLAISVQNGIDQMALMTSSSRAGAPSGPISAGAHTASFELPGLGLPNGEYSVTAALYDDTNFEVHRLDHGGRFVAETDNRSAGLHYTAATVRMS